MSCGINHRVGIKASPKEIYKVSTLDTDNSTQNAPSSTCPRGDPEWIVGNSYLGITSGLLVTQK
jgi:hypothetical protein